MTKKWQDSQPMNGKSFVTSNDNKDHDFPNREISPQTQDKTHGNNLILGLLLGVIGTFIIMKVIETKISTTTNNVSTPQTQIPATNSSQTITTVEAQITQVENRIETTGTVLAFELIPVMSSASNLQIKEVLVDEGDIVAQGDILLRLDDTILKAELAQAQAGVSQSQARLAELKAGTRKEELARARENVTFAQAEVNQAQSDLQLAVTRLERNKQLEAEGAIPRDRLDEFINNKLSQESNLIQARARLAEAKQRLQELEAGERQEVITQAEANLREAKARVKLIQARLAETIITAPTGGKIAERNARVGDVTSSFNSQKLFTIIEDKRLELQLKVSENQLKDIKSGQVVNIYSSANDNIQLKGKVRDINPIIDSESRQGIVNVDLPPDTNLQPGMFVQATIITSIKPSLTVPMAAVLPQVDGKGLVYTLQTDNTVKSQLVTLGEIIGNDRVEILSGLDVGDAIALQGVNYLQDGSQVKVVTN